ncbi:MAG: hypothetical protein NTV51_26145 [Verrucomicrobia bacterium]|nr:hypothetical protein [Verrucomicrobiota bacterium]
MKLTGDLKTPWLIHLKGILFAVAGIAAGGLLIAQSPTLRTAVLLGVTVWACCRFYYYLFYVLERYLGREKRFAGVFDALGFLLAPKRRKDESI